MIRKWIFFSKQLDTDWQITSHAIFRHVDTVLTVVGGAGSECKSELIVVCGGGGLGENDAVERLDTNVNSHTAF